VILLHSPELNTLWRDLYSSTRVCTVGMNDVLFFIEERRNIADMWVLVMSLHGIGWIRRRYTVVI
jgi:hypothetical protein